MNGIHFSSISIPFEFSIFSLIYSVSCLAPFLPPPCFPRLHASPDFYTANYISS